ncbi:MAG: hypothetical protein NZ959_00025 [Armatimonadetes bacterium]|nr:hypothetical protein [Armatimonadota bacterium]MDW8120699.1 hypothetical protein [Armatimonadota bacterium]
MQRWAVVLLMLGLVPVVAQGQQKGALDTLLVGVRNLSGYRGLLFSHEVAESLHEALLATGAFQVVRRDPFLFVPISRDRLKTIAARARPISLTRGLIQRVSLTEKDHYWKIATVSLEVALAMRDAPGLVFVAEGSGTGTATAEGPAVREAVEKAAKEAAEKLAYCWQTVGQVLLPPVDDKVRVSLDAASRIAVGAQVSILRKNQEIASGVVVEVDVGSSVVALDRVQPDARIRSGDLVRVTQLPTKGPFLTLEQEKEREYRRAEEHFFISLVLAGIGVAILGE